MFHSPIGLVHLVSALLAMVAGAVVLLNRKGSPLHKRIGYLYVAAMLAVNATAFFIYRVTGHFGVFHWFALVSLASMAGGMVPVLVRKHISGWIYWHYYFMSWSVVGLYAAFWAETFTRVLPMSRFWPAVVVATAGTMMLGTVLIRRNAAHLLPVRLPKAAG
ncbi:DUF2306 domain-containing protein [Hymenobacter endophyticus]|jgi:uncharacterized membrane protein|uniref:DUF2306 domain-containing protein n=1 Tax=Hymenobacter endophyticus TaxID=3076335 RepID=A0ABU3TJ90_9BACT|nr:DUF2306 domain-containing protein [Hymenobacter endophyticus]MDU0371433.1 DUF2306 domain-containing protein [Hymenobacter endophyticus]